MHLRAVPREGVRGGTGASDNSQAVGGAPLDRHWTPVRKQERTTRDTALFISLRGLGKWA